MTDLECYINTLGFLRFVETLPGERAEDPVYLAGDLRDSTPRILAAVAAAIHEAGRRVEYLGLIPTPAIANYALRHGGPAIMVTGSHIPADRNGIKFYKPGAEVMKEDEVAIKSAVAKVRADLYGQAGLKLFTPEGALLETTELPAEKKAARSDYLERYAQVFGPKALSDRQIVLYQHSAVGRDLIVEIFEALGAEVVPVGRSDVFVPIDSENVKPDDAEYFHQLSSEHPKAFAIVSTDGDSDRPFVIDELGEFHRGDVLGMVVAEWLGADAAAYPVSTNDAVDQHLTDKGVPWEHTRIGSPYVITAMNKAIESGKQRVVGWEVNGGFLTGGDIEIKGQVLPALPTRDAFLPILIALLAASDKLLKVSELFAALPRRYTQAGLIDDFPVEVSKQLVKRFAKDDDLVKGELEGYFNSDHGFGKVSSVNTLDGVRIYFNNGDIAHLRPSGNAPQLRIYSVANSQERADAIVAQAIAEPDGIFRRIEQAVTAEAEA
jgi:phosphomannomutase